MKRMKRVMAAFGALAVLTAACIGVFAAEIPAIEMKPTEAAIEVNGAAVKDAFTYETADGFTMVPIRSVCEALGIAVNWNDAVQRVELTDLPLYITFRVGEDGYTVARTAPMAIGKAPELKDSLTYVPLQVFSDLMEADVYLEENVLSIWYGEPEAEPAEDALDDYAEVKEAADGYVVVADQERGDVVLMIADTTVIKNRSGEVIQAADLRAGTLVKVQYGAIMTMSIPPMNTPIAIDEVNAPQKAFLLQQAPDTVTVHATVRAVIEGGRVLLTCEDGNYREILAVVTDETVITGPNGETLSINDFAVSARVEVELSREMTRSIPPQARAYTVKTIVK